MSCPACDAGYPVTKVMVVPVVQFIQVRFPRSKKKRIQKKWAKRRENWKFEDINALRVPISVMGHSKAVWLRHAMWWRTHETC